MSRVHEDCDNCPRVRKESVIQSGLAESIRRVYSADHVSIEAYTPKSDELLNIGRSCWVQEIYVERFQARTCRRDSNRSYRNSQLPNVIWSSSDRKRLIMYHCWQPLLYLQYVPTVLEGTESRFEPSADC